jgi:hypothetical protein
MQPLDKCNKPSHVHALVVLGLLLVQTLELVRVWMGL